MAETKKKGGKSFPQNKDQAEQFALQMIKIIHEDEQVKQILQQQMQSGESKAAGMVVGAVAAQLLTMLFTKLKEQTNGMPVGHKYVIEIIRIAVKELSAIADGMGMDTTVEDEQMAAKVAGDALDESMRGKGQPQEQPTHTMPDGSQMQGATHPQEQPQGVMAQAQGGM